MALFKSKQEKEIEKKMLIKRTINTMNKQINTLEEQKKVFVEKAKTAKKNGLEFATVTEAAKKYQPVAVLHCPHVMSWADEERDVTAWLGNELQNEAFSKLYAQKEKIKALKNPDFDYVWSFMQTSDHFYYMATKWLSDGDVHSYFNPYDSAYDAFINYMNVLSDFIIELDKAVAAKTTKTKRA